MSLLQRASVNPLNEVPATEAAEASFNPVEAAPAPATYQSTLPTAYQSTLPATQPESRGGFETLPVGFGTFPRVKLEGGRFWVDSEDIGSEFNCRFIQASNVYFYKPGEPSDRNQPFAYSYDKQFSTSGIELQALFAKWKSENRGEIRESNRANVVAEIVGGDMDGDLVVLDLPPESVKRLRGYDKRLEYRRPPLNPLDVVTRVTVSKPIKTKNATFTTWEFELAKDQVAAAA